MLPVHRSRQRKYQNIIGQRGEGGKGQTGLDEPNWPWEGKQALLVLRIRIGFHLPSPLSRLHPLQCAGLSRRSPSPSSPKYRTDPLAGLQKMVRQENIRNGVILSAIGSVRGYQVHQVSNRTLPSQDTFVKNPTEPADLVSMNGYVIEGKLHPHLTLATADKVIAGHLEPGTEVFTFAIVTIGVMNDVDFRHLDDKNYR